MISSPETAKINAKNPEVYLTAINQNGIQKENPKIIKLPNLNQKVHNQYLNIDVNFLLDKRKKDLKVLESLPLHQYKTFNKLREFYNGKNSVGFKELISKNLDDIKHKALTNPENFEKVMALVSEGRFGIDHQVTSSLFSHFKIK